MNHSVVIGLVSCYILMRNYVIITRIFISTTIIDLENCFQIYFSIARKKVLLKIYRKSNNFLKFFITLLKILKHCFDRNLGLKITSCVQFSIEVLVLFF